MTENSYATTQKPMCDDAENLAGARRDVRRCSDALGPRKNLHEREALDLEIAAQRLGVR
jgi:hypothetical protein